VAEAAFGRGPAVAAEFERTPPQDIAAEQSVLGGMLLSKDAIADVVEVLKPGDFYRPAHQTVYDAVLDLFGRGEPADAVTVAAELTRTGQLGRVGGAPYLHTLISSVPTAANAGYYAEIVRERAILRRLVEAGTRIVQLAYGAAGDGGGDVSDVVDRAQAAVYDVTEQRRSEDVVALNKLAWQVHEELETIESHGGVMTGVPTGFTDLDALTHGLHPGQLVIVAARPAIGKALALDTPLPTPTGWTTMGEVEIGSYVLGADGRATLVVAATEVMYDRPCFQVSFDDGSDIVADAEHLWLTDTRASRKPAQAAAVGYHRYRNQRTFAEVRTTSQIAATLQCPTADRRLNHSVRNARPLNLPERDLLVPPYTLGAWLGDGDSAGARFTTADPEILARIEADGLRVVALPHAYRYGLRHPERPPVASRVCAVCGASFIPKLPEVRTCGKVCGGRARNTNPIPSLPRCIRCGRSLRTVRGERCKECLSVDGGLSAQLRTLGVLGDKHIPADYLRASEAQRRALLAGLLDTDGTVSGTGSAQFTTTSARLAADVGELLAGLGYRFGISRKRVFGRTETSSTAYTLTFTTDDEVFRLDRKRLLHKERYGVQRARRTSSRFITAVRRVDSVPVRCIQVAADDQLYLAGRTMIPTHNSTLGLDVVRSAAIRHGKAAVIFSLEMSRSEITMRLLSAEASIPLHNMRTGHMTDEHWARLARRIGEVSDAPLYIDDSPNLSMMEIRAKARRLKQRHGLQVLVVDYLQLMSSPRRVESRQQEVSEISRALKLLAKELEVPVIALSQLNRGPEQRQDKKPLLSDLRECLTGDALITRADTGQRVPIRNLVGERDVPVWTLDERLRLRPGVMSDVWSTGVKPIYRMTLASGRQVAATANHPFLTVHGWKPVEALASGEHIAAARAVPQPTTPSAWPTYGIVLLAHMLGGGCVTRPPIYYCSCDEANLAVVENAARHFGVNTNRRPGRGVTYVHFPMAGPAVRGRTNPLYDWLRDLGVMCRASHQKRVPAPVHGFSDDQIRLFLRHLWATDGSVTVRGTGTGAAVRVYYATASRGLANDVQALLLRLGIGARLRRQTSAPAYRQQWTVDVSGRDDVLTFLTTVGVHGERGERCGEALAALAGATGNPNVDIVPATAWDYVRKAMPEHGVTTRGLAALLKMSHCGSALYKSGLSRERMTRVAEAVPDPYLADLATSDVRWDRIVAIEAAGEAEVFDAHVPHTHAFLANDLVSHNSGAIEQDADVVILLHREDAYERESPRAGEADLIVAKHRNGPTSTVTVAFQGHYSRFVDMQHG
jgi:replicative DNA helicase